MLKRGWSRIICVASGPSLDAQQVAQIAAAQESGHWRLIVINTTYQLFPTADVLYAADGRWWDVHITAARAGCSGEFWTLDAGARDRHQLHYVTSIVGDWLPVEPDVICQGGNSGHQAIGLAARFGARRIVLVGYDMQRAGGRTHWHGDHPAPLANGNPLAWVARFVPLAKDLAAAGISVVNASRETALQCFPRCGLVDALQ